MAEYGRKQNSQLIRAIANSKAGSRQLKEVVDNRPAHRVINYLQKEVHSENSISSKSSLQLKLLNDRVTQLMYSPTDYDTTMEPDDAAITGDPKDITYQLKIRNMFYPSDYYSGIPAQVFSKSVDPTNPRLFICVECKKSFSYDKMTIDHTIPVVHHFNTVGYRQTPSQRKDWYNDIANLQPMCVSCNCSKSGGGEVFDPKKVSAALKPK